MTNPWVEAAKSAYRFLSNPGRVPPEEYGRRLEICDSCDKLIPGTSRCSLCRCFMGQKAKFQAFQCPIGKWSNDDPI